VEHRRWEAKVRRAGLAAAAIVLSLGLVALLTTDGERPTDVRVLQPAPTDVIADEPGTTTSVLVETTTSTTSSTTTTTLPRRPGIRMADNEVVGYAWQGDVWVYGRSSGAFRVTNDEFDRYDRNPAFREGSSLTFLSTPTTGDAPATTLEELDLATGAHRVLLTLAGWVRAHAWTADGSAFAYIVGDEDQHQLRLRRLAGDIDVLLRNLGDAPGRGGFSNYDQIRLEWSPDGSKLLVVDTWVDSDEDPTLFVVGPDGADVVPPRGGTWADWSPDSRTVYFQWKGVTALDTVTGSTRVLIPGRGFRLSASPDGQFLAYDDGANPPSVFVYDLVGRFARQLHSEALGPMWLSTNTLLVGRAVTCVPRPHDDCVAGGHADPWTDAGTAWEIDLAPTASRPVALASTRDAAVRLRG
jgi:hypothetical protein